MLPRRLSTGIARTGTGAFNNRITLLKPNPTRTPSGGFASPMIFATVWANVSVLQGRDLEKAQEVLAEVTHRIVIRYLANVASDMTVRLDTRIFVIMAVQDPEEQKVELQLLCREINEGKV